MIFNKNNNGAEELHILTGSFAASSNFESIACDIEMETETIKKYIGNSVYDRAERSYIEGNDDDVQLVKLVQRTVALFATLRYLQSNLTTHSDSGRKVEIDSDNQKMAFEWMIDRDDNSRLQKAYKSLDLLLAWLERSDYVDEVDTSEYRMMRKDLLVDTIERFEQTYYIDGSYRFYYILCPLMLGVQSKLFKGEHISEEVKELACSAIILHTMSLALTRFSINVLPDGVVKQFSPSNQTTKASQSARQESIDLAVRQLRNEADEYMTELRQKQLGIVNPYENNNLMPKNSTDNKFFSL